MNEARHRSPPRKGKSKETESKFLPARVWRKKGVREDWLLIETRFLLGVMKISALSSGNCTFVNLQKTSELCTLRWWILWYVRCVSVFLNNLYHLSQFEVDFLFFLWTKVNTSSLIFSGAPLSALCVITLRGGQSSFSWNVPGDEAWLWPPRPLGPGMAWESCL